MMTRSLVGETHSLVDVTWTERIARRVYAISPNIVVVYKGTGYLLVGTRGDPRAFIMNDARTDVALTSFGAGVYAEMTDALSLLVNGQLLRQGMVDALCDAIIDDIADIADRQGDLIDEGGVADRHPLIAGTIIIDANDDEHVFIDGVHNITADDTRGALAVIFSTDLYADVKKHRGVVSDNRLILDRLQ